jgi:hypothetical protein
VTFSLNEGVTFSLIEDSAVQPIPNNRSSQQSSPLVKGAANRRAVKKRISVATDL